MKSFFWLCLLMLIPGMLARIDIGGAGILGSDLVLPIFAVVWLGHKVLTGKKFPRNRWIGPAFIFGGIALASFFVGVYDLGSKEKLIALLYLIRLVCLFVFGWAASDLFAKQDVFKKFFKPLLWVSGVVLILGFLQFFIVPDISTFSTEGGLDPHEGRLLGTWLDPNYLAGFFGFLLPLCAGFLYQKGSKGTKFVFLILIAGLIAGLFLTFSRSGYLAAGVGLFFFFLFRDWKIILIGVLLTTIGIATNERAQERVEELAGTFSSILFKGTDEIDPTASLRIQNWQKSFELFQKYPLLGVGYGAYRFRAAEEGVVDESYFSAGGADSSHLTILVTTGLLGFAMYLLFLGKMFLINFLRWWRGRDPLFLGFCGGFLAMLVHASFVNSLFFPLIFLPVIATAGVLESMKTK